MKKITFNNIWREGSNYIYEYHAKTRGLLFGKPIHIKFTAKYPHYNLQDILWMIDYTKQEDLFLNTAYNSTNAWSNEIDLEVGVLAIKRVQKANLNPTAIDWACEVQADLREDWTSETGIDYPDLEMPPRGVF